MMRPRPLKLSSATLTRLVVALNLTVALIYLGMIVLLIAEGRTAANDYTAFYTGWTIVGEGHGARLYDLAFQAEVQARVLDGRRFEAGVNPYNNPPHLTPPFVPLTWLPLNVSFLVWCGLQLTLLAWVLRRLAVGLAGDWRPGERWLLVSAVLAFPPLFIAAAQGTLSLLLLAAWLLLYTALAAGGTRAAAGWLVLTTLKPQLAVAPAAALLGARRWRVLGLAALLGAALAGLAALLLGPAIWLDYLRLLQDYAVAFDRYSVQPAVMWNLRGTLTLLLGREQAALINTVSSGVLLAAIGGLVWLWRGHWRPCTPAFDLRYALTLVIGLLVNPHVNPPDGLLLVLPAVLGYHAVRADARWRRLYGAFVLACPLLILLGNSFSVYDTQRVPIRVPVAAAIILAGLLALALRRAERAGPAAEAPAEGILPESAPRSRLVS